MRNREVHTMRTQGTWILLPENRAAWQAVERVRKHLLSRHHSPLNPLFLHGSPGCGKSRLVDDLVHALTAQRPDFLATRLSAADLTASPAEPEGISGSLRGRFGVDLLVLEDVQHLPARGNSTLEALLDDCLARQRQVVLTATSGPALLPNLSARLASRLAQGLVCHLLPLALESRREFLRRHVEQRGLSISADLLDWLAQHMPGSPRQLEGAITRLDSLARQLRRPVQLDDLISVFAPEAEQPALSLDRILQQVCGYFRVEPQALCSAGRSRRVLLPRQVGMYLARQLTGLSLEQIGAYFGGRDHSTVLHACRKVEQALDQDARISGAIRQLRADLL